MFEGLVTKPELGHQEIQTIRGLSKLSTFNIACCSIFLFPLQGEPFWPLTPAPAAKQAPQQLLRRASQTRLRETHQ